MAVAIVRQIIVRKRPATDSGIATAMDVVMASCWLPPPLSASTMMMAEATEARAASGATAAPMFAQAVKIIHDRAPMSTMFEQRVSKRLLDMSFAEQQTLI